MTQIKVVKIEEFLKANRNTWVNAHNEQLQGTESIAVEGDFLRIGKWLARPECISKFFLDIAKRTSLNADGFPTDLLQSISAFILGKAVPLKLLVVEDEIIDFRHKKPASLTLEILCEQIRETTRSELLSIQSFVDHEHVTVYSIDKERQTTPRKDDVVCGGMAVQASINGRVRIYPFSFRMWCSNGAVHRVDDSQKSWEFLLNGNQNSFHELFRTIKAGYESEVDATMKRICSLTDKTVETKEVVSFLRLVSGSKLAAQKRVVEVVSAQLRSDGSMNAYDFWNRLTAEYTQLASEHRARGFSYLRYAGKIGDVIADPPHEVTCKSCGGRYGRIF